MGINERGDVVLKKKYVIIAGTAALVVLLLIVMFKKKMTENHPFAGLSAEDILAVELFLIPPQATLEITDQSQLEEFTDILGKVTIYEEDASGREYAGQLVQYTITLMDGTVQEVGAYSPFLYWNGACYRTETEACEELSSFGNRIWKGSVAK